jgi:hypothetical protein
MKLACCGLDCESCAQRPKDCDGCHAEGDHLWHADCKIRVCCKFEKKLDNCSLCREFPCEVISAFGSDKWAHHRAAVKRLHELRAQSPAL